MVVPSGTASSPVAPSSPSSSLPQAAATTSALASSTPNARRDKLMVLPWSSTPWCGPGPARRAAVSGSARSLGDDDGADHPGGLRPVDRAVVVVDPGRLERERVGVAGREVLDLDAPVVPLGGQDVVLVAAVVGPGDGRARRDLDVLGAEEVVQGLDGDLVALEHDDVVGHLGLGPVVAAGRQVGVAVVAPAGGAEAGGEQQGEE